MRTLVFGDLHGAYNELLQALERANFNPEKDMLISLGDLCDRGPCTFEIVDFLSKLPNHICIRGNHDDWFIQWLKTGIHPDNWQQGGYATAISYAKNAKRNVSFQRINGFFKTDLNRADIPESHFKYFNKTFWKYIDKNNNLYVHGGINRHLDITEQSPIVLMWDRDFWLAALSYKDIDNSKYKFKIKNNFNNIFIGHTSTTLWKKDTPMVAANIIYNLDTGAGSTGKVTVMDVSTKEYWQSDNVNYE